VDDRSFPWHLLGLHHRFPVAHWTSAPTDSSPRGSPGVKARVANGSEANLWSAGIWRFPLLVFATAFVLRLVMLYMRLPLGSIPYSYHFETYSDFYVYYVNWWKSLQSGLVPYRDFFYQYPPLFLYGLYPLYRIGGAFGAALGIILADSGSAVLIYYIAKRSTTQKIALIAGLGYAANPLALLYEGYVLFSIQPMLFFLLLSVLLIRSDKLLLSAVCLAVAVLFKQEALFAVPAWLIYAGRFGLKSVAKATVLFVSILLIVSLPFLVQSPQSYVDTLAYHPPSYPSSVNASGSSTLLQTCRSVQNQLGLVASCTQNGTVSQSILTPLADQVTDQVFSWGAIPSSLLPIPLLYLVRRRPSFLALSAAYSFAVLIMLFGLFFAYSSHPDYRYYYLPVYGLLLVSGASWRTPLTAVVSAVLSLVLPPGPAQVVLPFLAIWAAVVVEGVGPREAVGDPTKDAASTSSHPPLAALKTKTSGTIGNEKSRPRSPCSRFFR
jgi:4-amino-4-deoxy-L-arabinose transferase-like glycosyltransferase